MERSFDSSGQAPRKGVVRSKGKPKHAIIAGTGIYDLPGFDPTPLRIETPFGPAAYHRCQGELGFLPRHGLHHDTPPHAINYRANFWALHSLRVESVVAAYAVGSLHRSIPLRGLALLSDFIDCTQLSRRYLYIGGEWGVSHADMSRPYAGSGDGAPSHLRLHQRSAF